MHENVRRRRFCFTKDCEEYELSLGFREDNNNDITPYGEWYGMNGQPWCAMFVSWCALQAGTLGKLAVKKIKVIVNLKWFHIFQK